MLEFINQYQILLIVILLLSLAIIIFFSLKNKRIKPIDLEEIEKKDAKTSIEEMLESLENTSSDRPMTTFEQEQEANAIISYQELVKAVELKKANSEFKKKEEIEEIVSEDSEEDIPVELTLEANEKEIVEEKKINEPDSKPKFKNSEFISPVFGKNTATGDDFLKELKDLRKNL